MTDNKNILPLQIKKIHIAKSQLGLSDQQYRDMLSGFKNISGLPSSSCKELNYDQAEVLLNIFIKLGFKVKHSGKQLKYEEFAGRDAKFASPKQMRSIDALWHTSINVRDKSDEAMNNFIFHITGISHITMIYAVHVHKIRKAIQSLKPSTHHPSPNLGEESGVRS